MFFSKKKLENEVDRLFWEVENLKIDKDVEHNQRLLAESEMGTAKINHKLCVDKIKELEADIANRMRYTVKLEEMVTKLDEENEILKEALKGEETFSSILSTYNDKLNKENEKLKTQTEINKNYIKNLEKEILIQRQTLKNKDEYISILHNDATLYTTITTKKQNSQLKDKLNRISAILNED